MRDQKLDISLCFPFSHLLLSVDDTGNYLLDKSCQIHQETYVIFGKNNKSVLYLLEYVFSISGFI